MKYGIIDFLTLLGSLGFFIYGMKIMSDGIQQAAGEKLRYILGAMTRNRYFGVGTGFLITAIVQSSSATTVMTVSFVNAGLLSLVESAGVMMGANIGTTVTAWILTWLGFKVSISAIALPLIAFGLPMFIAGKDKVKSWGQFIIGFALLFMGLEELKNSVPDVSNNPEILEFLSNYTDHGILSTLLFIVVGTVLTIIVQSSSATMALTLVMTFNGWIPFPAAAAMVLGENIGTTITAELASLVANVHAKRSARIHSTFNIIGVSWMIIIFPFFIQFVDYLMLSFTDNASAFKSAEAIPDALAIFHTLFNATNVLILIWFVPALVKLAIRLVPAKGDEDEDFHLEYIGKTDLLRSPEISLEEAKKEVTLFSKLILKMKGLLFKMIFESDPKKLEKLLSKLERYEGTSDHFEEEIDNFLVKISEGPLSPASSLLVKSLLSVTSHLERCADIVLRMAKDTKRGEKMGVEFNQEQMDGVKQMTEKLEEAFEVMHQNLSGDYSKANLLEAERIEKDLNKLKKVLWKNHLKSIENGDFNVKAGIVYKDLFSAAERLGDHVINVSLAITYNPQEEEEID